MLEMIKIQESRSRYVRLQERLTTGHLIEASPIVHFDDVAGIDNLDPGIVEARCQPTGCRQ